MSKDPAFLFYSSDFLTGTITMSDDQVGKYIRLLCIQHQKYELTEKDMLNICSTYDEDIFSKFVKSPSGKYYNEKLRTVVEKRQKYSESRANNRKGNKKENEHMSNTSKTYDSHMENENINSKEIKEYSFSNFWNAYDKREGSTYEFEKHWHGLPIETKKAIMEFIPAYVASTPNKKYRLSVRKFFEQQRWTGEVITDVTPQPDKLEWS